ncbi:hypothetical protein [Fervidibacter sacchari]
MAQKGRKRAEWKTIAVKVIFALVCGVLGMTLLALFFCVVGMVFFPSATPNIAFIATVLLGFVIVAVAGWLSTSKELWQD